MQNQEVTPFAGVWIEINRIASVRVFLVVTPFAGVWIEIFSRRNPAGWVASLPLRECGLKYISGHAPAQGHKVTPFAGVWIEIPKLFLYSASIKSLPLRECGLK